MHKKWLNALSNTTKISKIRTLGSIAAFDINNNDLEYGSEKVEKLKKRFLEKGLLLRPIGKTVYLMPPYCIDEDLLEDCYKKIEEVLE